MATIPPAPLMTGTDQLLLNRDSTTFKIAYNAFAENIAYSIIVNPDNNGDPQKGLLSIFDMNDVLGPDGVLQDNTKWVLQWDATADGGVNGTGQFILVDPAAAFDQALELDDLENVTGSATANQFDILQNMVDSSSTGASDFRPRSLQDASDNAKYGLENLFNTIMPETLFTGNDAPQPGTSVLTLVTVPSSNGVVGDARYALRDVGTILTEIISDPDTELPIDIQDLKNVTGIRVTPKLATAPDSDPDYVYDLVDPDKEDVLIYLGQGEVSGVPNTDPSEAGWYYSAVPTQEILPATTHDDDDEDPDTIAIGNRQSYEVGTVLVAKYRDSEFTTHQGKNVISVLGTTPSNIGISNKGVLFADIPDTLGFVQTIDIVRDAGQANDGKLYFDFPAIEVSAQGPGNKIAPGTWSATDLPDTGDFYVIRFVDNSGDPLTSPDSVPASTIAWNDYYDGAGGAVAGGGQNGPDVLVRDGDMVAFGEAYWNVIGTVNTDTVAQDLQSVTDRGDFTTNAIKVGFNETGSNAISANLPGPAVIVNGLVNIAGGTAEGLGYETGDLAGRRLRVNNIDFATIPALQ